MNTFICIICLLAGASAYFEGYIKIQRLSKVSSDFAQRLHQKALLFNINSIFSPINIYETLTMATLGAEGITAAEMNVSLQHYRFTGGKTKPYEAMNNVIEQWKTNVTHGTVYLVNAIFVNLRALLVPKFVSSVKTYYLTNVSSFNLSDPLGPERNINDDITNKTAGLVKDFLKPGSIDNKTEIVLASAMVVNTTWQIPFAKVNTEKAYFNTPNSFVRINFMKDFRVMNYKKDFYGADIGELVCRGGKYSLFILVPQSINGLAEQEKSLTIAGRIDAVFEGLKPTNASISIPKMKIESSYELSATVKALGIVTAFNSTQANFAGIRTTGGLYITKLYHKAIIDVNENGTFATPATSLAIGTPTFSERLAQIFSDYVDFIVDRPSIIFLRDNQDKIILLQGKFSGK